MAETELEEDATTPEQSKDPLEKNSLPEERVTKDSGDVHDEKVINTSEAAIEIPETETEGKPSHRDGPSNEGQKQPFSSVDDVVTTSPEVAETVNVTPKPSVNRENVTVTEHKSICTPSSSSQPLLRGETSKSYAEMSIDRTRSFHSQNEVLSSLRNELDISAASMLERLEKLKSRKSAWEQAEEELHAEGILHNGELMSSLLSLLLYI